MKDFVSFIKNYSTRDFIYFFSEISIELYKKQQNKSEDELRCSITFPLNAILHGFIHRQERNHDKRKSWYSGKFV